MNKAVVFDEYGPPDVLHVADLEPPEVGANQVRVEIRAAGIQPFDAMFRRGDAASWLSANFPQQLGNEVAGTVREVGADVTAPAVGQDVLGWVGFRGYAEQAVVAANRLVGKPTDMPWTEAAVLSASGQTASTALEDLGVGAGDTLLVHAAAGGVGSFAVQIAAARGATVIGTASERNHEYLRALGATPVSYGTGLVDRVRAVAPDGVDAALDAVGTDEALQASSVLVADLDRCGSIAAADKAEQRGLRSLGTRRSQARLTELVELYRRGQLRIEVQRTFALAEAGKAHRELEAGHVRGKLVLVND